VDHGRGADDRPARLDHGSVTVPLRIAARVEGFAPGIGSGPSKRLAEQEAARLVLEREVLGQTPTPTMETSADVREGSSPDV
jgi:ribonuclease-3